MAFSSLTAKPEAAARAADRPWAVKALPPFPAVALQLLELFDDDEAPMREVVTLLRIDPALCAEVLRLSNSALYGLSRRIDNVSHAVVLLGADAIKRLALTVAVGRFSSRFLRDPALRAFWDHSVACAFLAEQLAKHLNQPYDRAYTAGLLLDVGRLALLACHPDTYGSLLEAASEHGLDPLPCERRLFDTDHCAVGEWLARQWNLPDDLVAAIASHHTHEPADDSTLSIVVAADRIADSLGFCVLGTPAPSAVDETIDLLPIFDKPAAAVAIHSMAYEIRDAVRTIFPH
jgi:putative nucleotidyltransferase with HDIG domain